MADKQDGHNGLKTPDGRVLNVTTQMPQYRPLLCPNGFLVDDPACYALMYYAGVAMTQWEKRQEHLVYENAGANLKGQFRPKELMVGIATAYGVTPERMIRFWPQVDLTMSVTLQVPKVPGPLRFDATAELRTQ